MVNLIVYLLTALIAGLIVRYILAILTSPMLLFIPLLLNSDTGEIKRPILYYVSAVIANTWNCFVVSAWAAICVSFTKIYIIAREIDFDILYYFLGFLTCVLSISAILALEKENTYVGYLVISAAIISYTLFRFWNDSLFFIHGWWIKPLLGI